MTMFCFRGKIPPPPTLGHVMGAVTAVSRAVRSSFFKLFFEHFLSNSRYKKQLLTFFEQLFENMMLVAGTYQEISSNVLVESPNAVTRTHCGTTVEPPVATTSPQPLGLQNTKRFQVKSLYLEPLASDHLS